MSNSNITKQSILGKRNFYEMDSTDSTQYSPRNHTNKTLNKSIETNTYTHDTQTHQNQKWFIDADIDQQKLIYCPYNVQIYQYQLSCSDKNDEPKWNKVYYVSNQQIFNLVFGYCRINFGYISFDLSTMIAKFYFDKKQWLRFSDDSDMSFHVQARSNHERLSTNNIIFINNEIDIQPQTTNNAYDENNNTENSFFKLRVKLADNTCKLESFAKHGYEIQSGILTLSFDNNASLDQRTIAYKQFLNVFQYHCNFYQRKWFELIGLFKLATCKHFMESQEKYQYKINTFGLQSVYFHHSHDCDKDNPNNWTFRKDIDNDKHFVCNKLQPQTTGGRHNFPVTG